jgi:hypothetical protein
MSVHESVHASTVETEATSENNPPARRCLLSHDPDVTLEDVVASGGGDADEYRRSKGVHNLVPTARPDQVVRFLRARNGNVDAAAKMLRKHLEWRAEHIDGGKVNPENDALLKDELLKNKFCFYGRDLAGHHVVILRSRLLGKHTYKDLRVAQRALIQLAEYMESILEPLEKITVIVPKTGDTMRNSDLDCECQLLLACVSGRCCCCCCCCCPVA